MAEAIRLSQKLYDEQDRVPPPQHYAQVLLFLYDQLSDEEMDTEPTTPTAEKTSNQ